MSFRTNELVIFLRKITVNNSRKSFEGCYSVSAFSNRLIWSTVT